MVCDLSVPFMLIKLGGAVLRTLLIMNVSQHDFNTYSPIHPMTTSICLYERLATDGLYLLVLRQHVRYIQPGKLALCWLFTSKKDMTTQFI